MRLNIRSVSFAFVKSFIVKPEYHLLQLSKQRQGRVRRAPQRKSSAYCFLKLRLMPAQNDIGGAEAFLVFVNSVKDILHKKLYFENFRLCIEYCMAFRISVLQHLCIEMAHHLKQKPCCCCFPVIPPVCIGLYDTLCCLRTKGCFLLHPLKEAVHECSLHQQRNRKTGQRQVQLKAGNKLLRGLKGKIEKGRCCRIITCISSLHNRGAGTSLSDVCRKLHACIKCVCLFRLQVWITMCLRINRPVQIIESRCPERV